MDKIGLLVEILLDVNARVDERDDAAIDLGKYDDDRALNALLSIAIDPTAEPFIIDVCGESIAEIWVRRNHFDLDLYKKMNFSAQHEVYNYIAINKPKWVKEYNLDGQ